MKMMCYVLRKRYLLSNTSVVQNITISHSKKLKVPTMNSFKKKLYQYYLPKLIKNKCDATIPRSGEAGKKTNCYIVFLHNGTKPHLVIENIINDELICLQWNGNNFSDNVSINIKSTDGLTLKIEHYYGLDRISYTGIFDYVIERFTRYSYLRIRFNRLKDCITQYLFNRRSLETRQRFDFLKLLAKKFTGSDTGFSYLSVMTEMHTDRSFLHPEFDKEAKKIEAYLKGFANTGELVFINHNYHLTGFAYKAIHDYEEQDRKHKSATRIQYAIAFLTFILAILTAVQAKIIILPTLLDFS